MGEHSTQAPALLDVKLPLGLPHIVLQAEEGAPVPALPLDGQHSSQLLGEARNRLPVRLARCGPARFQVPCVARSAAHGRHAVEGLLNVVARLRGRGVGVEEWVDVGDHVVDDGAEGAGGGEQLVGDFGGGDGATGTLVDVVDVVGHGVDEVVDKVVDEVVEVVVVEGAGGGGSYKSVASP